MIGASLQDVAVAVAVAVGADVVLFVVLMVSSMWVPCPFGGDILATGHITRWIQMEPFSLR